ncbi:4'-phosphopantetheinyl transferase family protein, partial [Streptomyces clavuligerus]
MDLVDPVVSVVSVVSVATTAEVLDRPGLDERLLAPWELRRLARIRVPSRRDDVLAARLLLRLCAARSTGLPLSALTRELAQYCAECDRHGHGRPYLRGRSGVGVSLSHADGLAAAAVGPGAVGIDVEPASRRPGPLPVLERLLPSAGLRAATAAPDPGAALLRLWVRREALFKAGASDGEEEGEEGRGGPRLLEWTDRRRAAVVSVATAAPAVVLPVTAFPAPAPNRMS